MIYPSTFASENTKPPYIQPLDSHEEGKRSLELSGKRAVIVEDEGITQLQLKRILRREGVEVVGIAANGKEAIDIVLTTRPDLILMDINMPIMNGLEAAERILADYSVCVVMLTAYSDEAFVEKALQLGTSGYIVKPITAETLIPQLLAAYQKYHKRH